MKMKKKIIKIRNDYKKTKKIIKTKKNINKN